MEKPLYLFLNAMSCCLCAVARHTLILRFTGIALLPFRQLHLMIQTGCLFFNIPFNAVSPNPVHGEWKWRCVCFMQIGR